MEGGASGSTAVTDSAMAEAGAVDPDLALGVFSVLMFASLNNSSTYDICCYQLILVVTNEKPLLSSVYI
jgi:hypothetical protein